MSAAILNRLLRAPGEIAEDCREDRDLRAIAVTSLVAVALGAAAFGGVIGSFRGGIQILYAAVKLPAALLLTLAICAPAFHALAAGLGRAFPMRSIIALALASAGRAALVLLALSPLVFFAVTGQAGWIFRPYLVRPRTWTASGGHLRSVPFLRAYEGSFADAIYLSSRSARGVYDEAPSEGEGEAR